MKRPRFHVYKARSSVPMKPEWRWRLIAANGRILASGEGHTRKADAERAVETVKRAVAKTMWPEKASQTFVLPGQVDKKTQRQIEQSIAKEWKHAVQIMR